VPFKVLKDVRALFNFGIKAAMKGLAVKIEVYMAVLVLLLTSVPFFMNRPLLDSFHPFSV
jgi:hypothetical protein